MPPSLALLLPSLRVRVRRRPLLWVSVWIWMVVRMYCVLLLR